MKITICCQKECAAQLGFINSWNGRTISVHVMINDLYPNELGVDRLDSNLQFFRLMNMRVVSNPKINKNVHTHNNNKQWLLFAGFIGMTSQQLKLTLKKTQTTKQVRFMF